MPARKEKIYPAKLLLFGEYTVLDGGRALAVPYDHYSGYWTTSSPEPEAIQTARDWLQYLEEFGIANTYSIDTLSALMELEHGLTFTSTIPVGYGLGSSGAFTAALLERFGKPPTALPQLQEALSSMEAFFHGKSSGLDPLVSYLNQPVLVGNELQLLDPSLWNNAALRDKLWLWDSGKARHTAPLVRQYKAKLSDSGFSASVADHLLPATMQAIEQFLLGTFEMDTIATISKWQRQLLADFIPVDLVKIWQHGLDEGSYYFKFCGAGGGGFFAVYADDPSQIKGLDIARLKPLRSYY
jgi:mevalonate kinase